VRRLTTARLALLAAVWGSSFLWIKPTLRGPSPVEVTLARLLLGAAVLLAGPDWHDHRVYDQERDWHGLRISSLEELLR